MSEFDLDKTIRKIKDFPKPGVLFYDITSIFLNPEAFSFCIEKMYQLYKDTDIDGIIGVESRGFLFAAPLAYKMQMPLILARKKGKLPGKTFQQSYDMEYGSAEIEVHKSDIEAGQKYLVVDDLIASGETLNAVDKILEKGGAKTAEFFSVIGLSKFPYKKLLAPKTVTTLIDY